ncbi:hypothetical protein B0H16DRAFT_1568578, partial [Mycena metata]
MYQYKRYTTRGPNEQHHPSETVVRFWLLSPPLIPLVQQKRPLSSDARACVDYMMPRLMPQATPEERETIFRDSAQAEGSEQNAIDTFANGVKVLESGIVYGSETPPSNAVTRHFQITPSLGILYHPTIPREMQSNADFTWNFYITNGKRQEILEIETSKTPSFSSRERVKVITMDWKGEWVRLELLTAPPGTRVRVIHPALQAVHEVIFPDDPLVRDSSGKPVHIHLLPMHL